MMRPRWSKVFKDLWIHRVRSLLVVASIAVGLFAMGVITTLYSVINADMRSGYESVNPANIYISSVFFDQEWVDHIARLPNVRQAEGVRAVSMRVRNKTGDWQSILLKAYHNSANRAINQILIHKGRAPEDGEVVIDEKKLKELNVNVGDVITLELPSGKTRELRISGISQDMTIGNFGGGGGFFLAGLQGSITQGTLDKLEQPRPDSFNGLYLTIKGDSNNLELIRVVAAQVNEEFDANGIEVQSSKIATSNDHPNSSLVDAIIGTLVLLGLFSVFLSGFLVTNTLQALLSQQTQQIGIMKSIGGRQTQIAGIYFGLILIYGLLAFLVAVPLAYLASFPMLTFLAKTLNFVMLGERFVPEVVIMQGVLALLMPLLASFVPIWQGTHISVQEALTGLRQSNEKRKPKPATAVKKSRRPGSGLLSRPNLIAVRNTFRRKGRLLLTLFTLSLGGAVFIATFNVQVAMDSYIQRISQYFLADVNVYLVFPYRTEKISQILTSIPGVGEVEAWAFAPSKIIMEGGLSGEQVSLLAPPPNSRMVNPIQMKGRWILPGDTNAIVLNELFLTRFPELDVGSTLHLRMDGKDTDWVVVGYFQLAGKNGGFSAYASFDYLSSLLGTPKSSTSFRVKGDTAKLTAQDQAQLRNKIEERLTAEGVRVGDITTGSYLSQISGEGLGTLTTFLLFLSGLTALIGSIGLAGTMSMNVMERTREIGILRSIGASNWTLMRMVLLEGMIIGALSYLIGAALSFPISKMLSDSITISIFGATSSFGVATSGFIIWAGVVMVLAFFASIVPARNAARLTIREVLAYE